MFKAIFWWFIVLVVLLAGIMFFVPNTWIESVTEKEKQTAIEQFGEGRALKSLMKAHNAFDEMFVQTGIEQQTFSFFIPKQSADGRAMDGMASGLFGVMYGRIAAFWAAVYQGVVRYYFFLSWLVYLSPFIAAVIVDAAITRKIRVDNFEFASPIRFGFAIHSMIFGIFFIAYYFLAPFTVTYVVVPVWIVIMLAMLYLMVTNVQRTN